LLLSVKNQRTRKENDLRVGNAEAEAIGDGAGDVLGQVGELRLHGAQLRPCQRRRRRERRQLAARDAGEQKQQHGEVDDDARAPPQPGRRPDIAHSDAEEREQGGVQGTRAGRPKYARNGQCIGKYMC
jgi:hypothetical protein